MSDEKVDYGKTLNLPTNNASKKLLATGSNDKFIKIFEINNEEIKESANSEMSKNVKEK